MKKILEQILLLIIGISCLRTIECGTSNYLSNFPDSWRLNQLAFIGTHDSAAFATLLRLARTQEKSITQQLESGIRVLDMRVRLTDNKFAMHHGPLYLGKMFGDMMIEIKNFFEKNPKELIIIFMQIEHNIVETTLSECEILENYNQEFGNLFVKNWSVRDNLGQHRGKILLAKAQKGFWDCSTKLPCKFQNKWELNETYRKHQKWESIKALQDDMFDSNQYNQCYVNYLSANGGPFYPTPRELAKGVAGQTEGLNDRMRNHFRNPLNTLVIIMADFPSQLLINHIIRSNNPRDTSDIVDPTNSSYSILSDPLVGVIGKIKDIVLETIDPLPTVNYGGSKGSIQSILDIIFDTDDDIVPTNNDGGSKASISDIIFGTDDDDDD